MKKLPLGIQTFRTIIEDQYLYIDKTKQLINLFSSGKYYFLSRPRRFGKSLLISTLKEIFLGNQQLFEGLYIHDKIEWKEHPIIHIDFSTIDYNTPDELTRSILSKLKDVNKKYNLSVEENSLKNYFEHIIAALYNTLGSKVVILIDEYDKPIIDFINNKDKAEANREVLRGFYSILKGTDEYLQFVFLTGVSKFSKVSVFSGLNNILDITLDGRFTTLLGITKEELVHNFQDHISALARREQTSEDQLLDDIQEWYNGYSWDGENRVYNPTSLLTLFTQKEFDNYWFATATPNFLIETMKKRNYPMINIEETKVGKLFIDSYDVDKIDINSLLLQTGYLTIKKIIRFGKERLYVLSCPNLEVKDSLLNYIFADLLDESPSSIKPHYIMMVEALKIKDLETFISIIKSMFAKIPYTLHLKDEAYYHSLFYLMLALMGVKINLEVLTDKGRMDGVLELGNLVYVIELKRGTAQEAIDQINHRRYYEPYLDSGKEIYLLGIAGFDNKDIHYICKSLNG